MTCYKTDHMKQQNDKSRKVKEQDTSFDKNINVIIAAIKNGKIYTIIYFLTLYYSATFACNQERDNLIFIVNHTKKLWLNKNNTKRDTRFFS